MTQKLFRFLKVFLAAGCLLAAVQFNWDAPGDRNKSSGLLQLPGTNRRIPNIINPRAMRFYTNN